MRAGVYAELDGQPGTVEVYKIAMPQLKAAQQTEVQEPALTIVLQLTATLFHGITH